MTKHTTLCILGVITVIILLGFFVVVFVFTVKSPTSLLSGFHLQRANYPRTSGTSGDPKWLVVAFWSFHLSRPKAERNLKVFFYFCAVSDTVILGMVG